MTIVTNKNASEDSTHSAHHWVTEASSLGLHPGEEAEKLETDLGNGLPFLLVAKTSYGWEYRQEFGCLTLTVFND